MKSDHKKIIVNNSLTRRNFIKQTAIGTAGFALAGNVYPKKLFSDYSLKKSKVILIRHSKVLDESGKIQQPLLQEMLDRAIIELSGKNTLIEAWQSYFSPQDVIGIKINTLGLGDLVDTDFIMHFTGLSTAIVSGLEKAGMDKSKIIIWDRSDEELANAGFNIQKEQGALRIMGNKSERRGSGGNFGNTTYPVGDKSTRVSAILDEMCTALINVPVLKTHGNAILTNCLKNHYGSISNPRDFHDNYCTNPGIPEVNTIPVIRSKQRLNISDALLTLYDGGPRWRKHQMWHYGGLIVGTDPVAVDAVGLQIIDEKRKSENLQLIEPRVNQLILAEKLDLGNSRTENIELIKIDLG